MKDNIVREATLSDYDTLLRFEQGVISAERPFDPTLKDDPVHYYDIKGMIEAPHIHLVVAERDGQLMGCGYARIENSKVYLRHSTHAYLGFMYTEPQHRGQGVNKEIIHALRKWAVSKGIVEMRLDVYYGNTPAQRAYVKAGFLNHMIEMRMSASE